MSVLVRSRRVRRESRNLLVLGALLTWKRTSSGGSWASQSVEQPTKTCVSACLSVSVPPTVGKTFFNTYRGCRVKGEIKWKEGIRFIFNEVQQPLTTPANEGGEADLLQLASILEQGSP